MQTARNRYGIASNMGLIVPVSELEIVLYKVGNRKATNTNVNKRI